jgi:toxin CptA
VIKPLQIPLPPSRLLVAILVAAHLLALGIPWVLRVDWTMHLGFSAIVAMSAVLSLRRLLNNEVVALRVNVKGEFSVLVKSGEWLPASIQGSSFVAPYMTILHLRLNGKPRRYYVVLMPDAVPADDFRKLRVWLKWRDSQEPSLFASGGGGLG